MIIVRRVDMIKKNILETMKNNLKIRMQNYVTETITIL